VGSRAKGEVKAMREGEVGEGGGMVREVPDRS